MILPAKHFSRQLLITIILGPVVYGTGAQAQEVYYFGDRARDLEVSADAETLFSFPAPPFARVCQPSGVVELYPLVDNQELDHFLIPRGIQSSQFSGLPTGSASEEPGSSSGGRGSNSDLAARHLKLLPKRTAGTTTCAIRLSNEQVINVRLTLSKMVNKPIIEFRSIMEKAKAGAALSQALGPINLFRAFVSGGDVAHLADETPAGSSNNGPGESEKSDHLRKSTSLASYSLVFVGTDKDLYKAWRFEGTAISDFSAAQAIRNAKLGEFYFSVFRERGASLGQKTQTNTRPSFQKGQGFLFFVLSRSDISTQEMMEKLP
jgi:hypothetical protein